ncbi:hypothetical protein [Blastococcus saxobsidens]|uniref:Uncharacterized protein n=1 Tax=Blastococcus saxobsidens (strain DD2) TaxID=1146883 RepID=H6RJ36_BLASD|nr:hypothetical protein [Blastococcus saxobsidens]CCG04781.1 exported protein of unknown function [Blastococcus saxobsidens DD2]
MRGRRIWALLAVAAVLAMHGVQCMSGSVGSAHVSVAAPAVPLTVLDGGPTVFPDGPHHVAALGADASTPLHPAPGGIPAHGAEFWTICLAVVFAALALVSVATLFRGRVALLVRGPPPSLRGLRRRYRLPAAPDLSTLCLLRI